MKRILCLILLTFTMLSMSVDDYTLINSIRFDPSVSFTTDKLGNVFVITENQLLEFNAAGKPVANFSRTNLGELRSVDASNPLKIVLFYPAFAQIVLLNNKLSETSTIQLRNSGVNQPIVVCNSENEGYWIYDREDDQLKKLDLNLQIVNQSGNLTAATGYSLLPNFLCEGNNNVYVNDPRFGIFVFDRYGTYYKLIPVKDLKSFQVVDRNIIYLRDNQIFRYDTKTIEDKEILLPPHGRLSGGRIEQQQLYLLTSDSLNFYSF